MFQDEKIFWEHCGVLLVNSRKYSDAVPIFEYLFKSDPYSKKYLDGYIQCLIEAFMFVELEDLLQNLKDNNWIEPEDLERFNWRSQYPDLAERYSFNENTFLKNAPLETLHFPIRSLNWSSYAAALHSMASGDFAKIFKKHPFNPDNYCILNGPCCIEVTNGQSHPSSGNTQSLLMNSVGLEYSASSLEDVSTAQSAVKRSSRRKETKNTQNSQLQKTELTPADFVKNLKCLYKEEDIIGMLCSTERSCLQLLDKNNIQKETDSNEMTDASTFDSSFTVDSLLDRIKVDNEAEKPLALRIFDLMNLFFVTSSGAEFPSSLTCHIVDLVMLFKNCTFSFQNLKDYLLDTESQHNLLLGICEIFWDSGLFIQCSNDLSQIKAAKSFLSESSKLRLEFMEILAQSSNDTRVKLERFSSVSSPFVTRFSVNFPHIIDESAIQQYLLRMSQSKTIKEAEDLVSKESKFKEALEFFSDFGLVRTIDTLKGELKLRLCKVALSIGSSDERKEIALKAIKTLIECHAELEIKAFSEYISSFVPFIDGEAPASVIMTLFCIFWNIHAHKQLISAPPVIPVLNSAFALFLNGAFASPPSVPFARFIMQWMAQEKVFGSCDGIVPMKIFRNYAQSEDLEDQKFAFMIAFSLLRFPNVFASTDPDLGWEEWDRAPIGMGPRDSPCPCISESDLLMLCSLVNRFDSLDGDSGVVVSEPGFVGFVDWFRKQFTDLSSKLAHKNTFRCIQLNRSQLGGFLNFPIEQHALKQISNPSRGHFDLFSMDTRPFSQLLNARSELVHSELQGRKKSLDILKTIRSDLKLSLAMDISDPGVWKLLGTCYYDAAVHFMSSEAATIVDNSGKLKRMLKKAILALQQGLRLEDPKTTDRDAWVKLMDICDWSLHDPAFIPTAGENSEVTAFICSIGCSCVQKLLPGVIARDRWILFVRLELFLRRSGALVEAPKQLELLKEAAIAACAAYSENVYESTALFMSLVKFYSRLSKLLLKGQIDEQDVSKCLKQLQGHLPVLVQCQEAENVRELLQNHLEALNALDRKKIFHAHLMAAAMNAWKLLNDPKRALLHLQQLFPFLKGFNSKKGSTASLMQIYQCDHERPARYLVAGRRYLIQLLDFIASSGCFDDPIELLTQFLKKLHYVRKTILGFPEILAKATMIYLQASQGSPDQSILDELEESLTQAFNGKIPHEIDEKLKESQVNNSNNINK